MKSRHLSCSGIKALLLGCALAATAGAAEGRPAATPSPTGKSVPRNVLFIAVDDLRPILGCYDNQVVKTPNIDRLAARGVVFDRAYCQDSVCSPSRISMLTGLRPDETHIFDNATHFRVYNPDVVTLPQQFRTQGYRTVGMGKIFHSQWDHAYVGRRLDDAPSWSEPAWFPPTVQFYFTPEGKHIARQVYAATAARCRLHEDGLCVHNRQVVKGAFPDGDALADPKYDEWTEHFVMGPITEAPDVSDNTLYDGQLADHAVETLKNIGPKPFFMAVGFIRPHVPYVAPKRYWDLYDPSKLPVADNRFAPAGSPPWSLLEDEDHDSYVGIPQDKPVDDALARHITHGYYACVSYIDAQIGRVLAELDRQGLTDNTIIVLWGDHGYHLGENSRWGKQTCFEMANRQPLIIAAPGRVGNGQHSMALVESVDIYPTLCELAGLPRPASLEGSSMMAVLDRPEREWKSAVFSQFPRPVRSSARNVAPKPDDKMGYSMRTDRYRYIEWRYIMQPDKIAARELYDHSTDPKENTNLAVLPGHDALVQHLHEQLDAGWRAARPPGS